MQKHAVAAGLGAPVRLQPVIDPFSGSNTTPLTQEKATGALQGTTAAIGGNQHRNSATHADATPEAATDAARLSLELIHSGGERLAKGNPSECRKAWQKAQKALGAAIDSLDMLLGGQPT